MKLLMVCCVGLGLAIVTSPGLPTAPTAKPSAAPIRAGGDVQGSPGIGNRGGGGRGGPGGTGGEPPFAGRPIPIR